MDEKKYISQIKIGTGEVHYIKDAEAREDISDIKLSITGAMHWRGFTTTALVDGSTTNPIVIDGDDYTAESGDVVAVQGSGVNGAADKEFVFNGTKWQEYGSTGSLKALAFKDTASASYTPAGTNADSAVTFDGQATGSFVTGYNDDAVAPTFVEGQLNPGTLPIFHEGEFSAGTLPSFTEGSFDAGTLPSFTEGEFSAGTLPSFTEGAFSAGTLPSLGAATTTTVPAEAMVLSYTEASEQLTISSASTTSVVSAQGTFSAGTLPSKAADTFSAGTLPSKAADTFSAGVLPSKDSDTFSAGTLPSKGADIWDHGTLPSKAADTFNAGSAATLATASAVTNVGTGTAAGQVFSGTAATITVS